MSTNTDLMPGIKCFDCGAINWPTAKSCMRCTAALDRQYTGHVYQGSVYSSNAYVYQGNAYNAGRSFSQKVARFFEIADYILLLPGTFGLLVSMALFPVGPLIIGGWYALGCLLLRGFYRHSRGRLSNSQAVTLWASTFAYNLIELLVIFGVSEGRLNLMYVWPLLVMQLSLTALVKDLRETKPVVNY